MISSSQIYNQKKYFQCVSLLSNVHRTPLKNNSALPSNQMFLTQAKLGSLDFNNDEILRII